MNKLDLASHIFNKLKEVNQDFREISGIVPKSSTPVVELYEYNQGPFALNDIRLKHKYIRSS